MDESIYNLIPREERTVEKAPRYVSKHATRVRQEEKSKKKSGATMGPVHKDPPSTKTFLKKGTGGAGATVRKTVAKSSPKAQRKPAVPRHTERPVMGLKTQRNYLKDNAVNAVTAKPGTQRKGGSAKGKQFSQRKDYGKTPAYLTKRKEDEARAQQEYAEYVAHVQAQGQPYEVPADERQEILDGLKSNWEMLHKEFLGLSVTTDTAPKKQRKFELEQRLSQLESDINKIERHRIILVTE
jgi:hypothetical protein